MSEDWFDKHARAGARRREWAERWRSWRTKALVAPAGPRAAPLTDEEHRIEMALRERVSNGAAFALFTAGPALGFVVPLVVESALGLEVGVAGYVISTCVFIFSGIAVFTRLASSERYAQQQRQWLSSLPFPLQDYPALLGSDRNRPSIQVRVSFASPPPPERQTALVDACRGALGSKVASARVDGDDLVFSSPELDCLVMPESGDFFVNNGPMHLWTKAALKRFLLPLQARLPLKRVAFKAVGG